MVVIFGCNSHTPEYTTTVDGDLYFGHFRFVNLYGLPDSIAKKTISYFEENKITNEQIDTSLLNIYSFLKKENLLYSPFIQLKTTTDTIITVFMEKSIYSKIAPTDYQQLIASNKKLRLKIESQKMTGTVYRGLKILSIDSVYDNKSNRNGKFKLEDYY
jgi:hypothetical protein